MHVQTVRRIRFRDLQAPTDNVFVESHSYVITVQLCLQRQVLQSFSMGRPHSSPLSF